MSSDVQLMSRIVNGVALLIIIQLGSKSLFSSEDEEDESFSMFLLVISETGFSWKSHGEGYLEILFAEFVEPLDISDNDRNWWSRSSSSLINGQGLSVNDEDEYNGMISKLRRSKIPWRIFLVISPEPLGIERLSNDNHSIHAQVETAPPSPSVVGKSTTDFLVHHIINYFWSVFLQVVTDRARRIAKDNDTLAIKLYVF